MVWLHHKKAVHLHHKGVHTRGCTQGGALVSSAPTKQKVHQPKNSTNSSVGAAETAAPPKVHQPSKKCTNLRIAPTVLLVQLRQLHPLGCTNQAEITPQQ